MKLVGLISGGKDSIYSILQCFAAGHEVVALANIEPSVKRDDMDSYMYQTVGNQMLNLISRASDLPIYRQKTKGIAICKEKIYVETAEDEVEDLLTLLAKVKAEMNIEGVAVGTIASDYQRTRVENVCMRLNLKCYAFLWKRDQHELLQEMIDSDMHAIIIKVAALGLKPNLHLGTYIKDLQPFLNDLHKKFGINVCGEGGEYETLTLDCPLYHRRINIVQSEKIVSSEDAIAPVGYLSIKNAGLENKVEPVSLPSRIEYIKKIIRPPIYYIQDCLDDMISKICTDIHEEQERTSSEVLPFPFETSTKILDESKSNISDSWKSKSTLQTSYIHVNSHSSHMETLSPSLLRNTNTSIFQLHCSTGWFCIGNITCSTIKEALDFGRKHLKMYEYDLQDVVSVNLFVRDMNEWAKINKVYSQSFPNYCPPTRSFVSVPLSNDVDVIITLIAHKRVSKNQNCIQHMQNNLRDVIHVQSISHWAPANIGSYSQCVRIGEIIYIAGQIPLIPGTMELLNKPILHQYRLTLRHIFRILLTVNECYTLKNIMHGICYVTSIEIAQNILDLWSYLTHNKHAVVGVVVVLSLPKNAELEWVVLACGYSQPQVDSSAAIISEDFLVKRKRCLYPNNDTSAVICNISYVKKTGKLGRDLKSITADDITTIMKHCVQYLQSDMVTAGSLLCMFNVFYKSSELTLASTITETLKASYDFKVAISCIPIVAFNESDVFLTISGVCH